ncbi:MAG: hypothetical protein IIC67_01075 [Thaumarchaeota archaeon]|nr:hypothetical protein [Nitrososphaerota archaeon]
MKIVRSNMNKSNTDRVKKVKLILVVFAWIIISVLFYTGIVKMDLVGHIEISAVVSFSVILLGLHLFSIIKKEVRAS